MSQVLFSSKKKLYFYIFFVFSVFLSIMFLFLVKYTVYNLKKEVRTVEIKIEENLKEISVLEAEWAYLNSPERLKSLLENAGEKREIIKVEQIKDLKILKPYYYARNEKFGNNNFALGISGNEVYY